MEQMNKVELDTRKYVEADMNMILDEMIKRKKPVIISHREMENDEHFTAIRIYKSDFAQIFQAAEEMPHSEQYDFLHYDCEYSQGESYSDPDRGDLFKEAKPTLYVRFRTTCMRDFVATFAISIYDEWYQQFYPDFYEDLWAWEYAKNAR